MPQRTVDPTANDAAPALAMQAVMEGDRAAWLRCFAEDALLRDPVGGSPLDPKGAGLRGHDALGAFWDAVVAPAKSVEFAVAQSFPSGNAVAKVASVKIRFPNDSTIEYDGVFAYELDVDGRIQALSGYFSIPGAE